MGFPTPSTASPNGLLTYPLDTIDEDSVGSTIPAFPWPANTPATENRQNKSYDKIKNNNNDRPDDDDDDVDCFPRQDKQPVLQQQDISPTSPIANNTSPSLIESSTDNPATKNKSYNNIENSRPDDDDVECFPRQDNQPVLQQDTPPQEQLWYSFSIPAYTHNPTQAPRKPTPKRTLTKQSASWDNKNMMLIASLDKKGSLCHHRTSHPPHPPRTTLPLV